MRRFPWLAFAALLLAFPPPLRAEPEVALVVVVTDEASGAPLERARVVVWDEENLWSAVADAQGRARFERGPAGTVQVYAEAERHTAAERHDVELEPGAEVRLALGPGVPFEGTVLGPDGKPLGPVLVQVEPGGTFEGYSEMRPGRAPYARVTSDAGGRFRVLGIPPGAVGTVVVEVEGYETARVAVRAVGEAVRPAPLTIRLAKGCRVFGRVTQPDGSPAAGAEVYVVAADDEDLRTDPRLVRSSSRGGLVRALTAEADAEGRYAVPGLALGVAVVVSAQAEGFARSPWSEPLTPTAGLREVTADLALRRAATLTLTVATPEGGAPSGLRVRLGRGMGAREPEEGSAPGTVRFVELEPGEHLLSIDSDEWLDLRQVVVVAEGAQVARSVTLDRGATVLGRVLDEAGKPLVGVRVEAECKEPSPADGGWREIPAARATTGADGGFSLSGLTPGRHVLVIFGRNLDLPAPVEVVAPAQGLVLRPIRQARVTLRLAAPAGAPVPRRAFVWERDPSGTGHGGTRALDAEGRLTLEGLKGRTVLDLRVDGYVRVVREVDAQPGAELDLGTIPLEVGLTLKGRVLDRAGAPVEGASLSFVDATDAASDAAGAFSLPHLSAGEVELEVGAPGFLEASHRVRVAADGPPVTLTLSRGARLTGVVRDGAGQPLAEHWFRVEHAAPERASGWKEVAHFDTDERGAFEVRVPEGAARIAFYRTRETAPVVLAELAPKEGEERVLTLTLREP